MVTPWVWPISSPSTPRSKANGYISGSTRLALAQLPERQRTILLLRDDEGLAYAEIADVLGTSLAAVKINLFRARAAFRAAYAAFDTNGETA